MRFRPFLACAALLAASLVAHADTIDYTVTGGGNTYVFSLDQNPTVLQYASNAFLTEHTTVVVNGVDEMSVVQFATPNSGLCTLVFPQAPMTFCDAGKIGNDDNTYFIGSTSNPTLLAGIATFLDSYSNYTPYTVVATDVPSVAAATPEPSSLALLGTGLLGVVGTVRRRLA